MNDTIVELVKTLEGMRAKKDALDIDIAKGASLREELNIKLAKYTEEFNKVNGT